MAIGQKLLLHESSWYAEATKPTYISGRMLSRMVKRKIFISHAPESFRMAEGLIVMLRKAGIEASFDWDSGYFTDEENASVARDLKARIASSDVLLFLSTAHSVVSENCLMALRFASLVNRPIYEVRTTCDDSTHMLRQVQAYNEMTIEVSKGVPPRYLVRVQEPRHNQLWHSITNASQL